MSLKLRIMHCLRAPEGGVFRHVHDLVQGQAKMGAEIGVICDMRPRSAEIDRSLDRLRHHCALGITRIAMTGRMGFADWLTEAKIAKLAARHDTDILHGHGSEGGAYARIAAAMLKRKGKRIRAVYTPHGGNLHHSPLTPLGRFYRLAERRLARCTDGLIFDSRAAHRLYADAVGTPDCPVRIVPNGLYPHEFYEALLEENAADFVFIGDLRKANGIDTFLEAFAGRQMSVFPGHALIVGNGSDEDRYRKLARKLKLNGRVSFLGPQPVRTAFVRGRCVVVLPQAESSPYIVLEAAAARMPLITTNVGGIREIVGDVGVTLVPPGDVEALASQLRLFLAEPDTFLSRAKKLQERVAQRFTVEHMTRDISDFYVTEVGAGVHGMTAATRPEPVRQPNEIPQAASRPKHIFKWSV